MIDEVSGEWMTTIPLKDKQALLRVARAARAIKDGKWLENYDDKGPLGEGWQSNELKLAGMNLDKALNEASHLLEGMGK